MITKSHSVANLGKARIYIKYNYVIRFGIISPHPLNLSNVNYA